MAFGSTTQALIGLRTPFGRDPQTANDPHIGLSDLITNLTYLKNSSPAIYWPDQPRGSRYPNPRSQPNIEAFVAAIGVTIYRNEFTGRSHIAGLEGYSELSDEAIESMWLRADRLGLKSRSEYFSSVIRDIARRNGRNPVTTYFADLKWDGRSRLDSWLIDYAGAEDTPLNRAFGRLWMIAAVRRARKPGTKFDQILILEGKQGVGKSTLAKILADAVGPGLFEDGLQLGAETKQVIELTRSKLIVEISELRGNNREAEAIKAMLSRIEDSARLSYDRETSNIPRQFVMIGTTNIDEYLVDPTGNRRFWPVRVGDNIKLTELKRDAAQLWAEAAALERTGVGLELSPALYAQAASAQSERVVKEPAHELLAAELGDLGGVIGMEVLYAIVGLEKDGPERLKRQHQQAIGRAMSQLGWTKTRRRVGSGQRAYSYEKRAAVEYAWSLSVAGQITRSSAALGFANVRPIGQPSEKPAPVPGVPGPVPTSRQPRDRG